MLPFLPPPYQDELLYSILARYHLLSMSPSQKQTLLDLFGYSGASAVYDLPSRLSALSSRLPAGSLNTPDRLLRRHTMFPLYEPFLPKRRARAVAAKMMGTGKGGGIHMSIGVMASGVPSPRTLRFCSACREEEMASMGEPYWHRTHQAPGVLVCHHHGLPLRKSTVAVVSQVNKHRFVSAFEGTDTSTDVELPSGRFQNSLRPLAEMAASLLDRNFPPLGLEALRRRYLHILRERGLASICGRVAQRELAARFIAFYGEELLAMVGCTVDLSSEDNWLSSMMRQPRKASHPLRHLWLLNFLRIPVDEFFSIQTSYAPFGRGPWPCLNPVAEHFREPVIGRCRIGRNCETGAPMGTFACVCGFAYSRSGPDRSREDRYKTSRIVSRGKLWERNLLQLVETQGYSLISAAKKLHVTVNTVSKHLREIGQVLCGKPAFRYDNEGFRKAWSTLIADNPGSSRNDLRRLRPALFSWLYRNDREWLLATSTNNNGKRSPHDRVDWEARDTLLAEAVRGVTSELERKGEGCMISVSRIGKSIGALALLQRRLGKLPKTKAALIAAGCFQKDGR